VKRHADLVLNLVHEQLLFDLHLEVNLAQQLAKSEHAILNHAQLTAFCPHGPNGALALRLAVQE